MDCDDVLFHLAAATDAPTLAGAAGAHLRDHLDECAACRAVAAAEPTAELHWVVGIPKDALEDRDLLVLPVIDPILFAAEAEIAHGGMGRITRARDRRLGRDVAIKEVLAGHLTARFEREVAITAQLQHPAIVPVYEAGQWPDGSAFYAMRLVSGGTLGDAIGRTRTLEERLALLPHVVALTDALAYAHSKRIVHRDLKPGNVLVGEFGETVVIDWGLAKDLHRAIGDGPVRAQPASVRDLTVAGAVLGTPGYMAPEQATGRDVDERADVYALGSILYTLLVGAAPYWDGETTVTPELIDRRASAGPPTPIAQLAPRVPADLQAIVARAMAWAPAARYPTAKEMAEELRRFTAGQLLRSREYRLRELVARWVRRHRGAVAVGGVALAVLAVVSAVAVRQIFDREAETRHALAESQLEQGRQLLVGGDAAQAAPYLAAALAELPEDPIARRLAAAAVTDAPRHLASIAGTAAAFRGDGAELAIGRADGAIELWDPERGVTVRRLAALPSLGGAIADLVYAPDGGQLAVASASGAYLRDARSGALVAVASPRVADEVRVVPRGFVFAHTEEGVVRLVAPSGAVLAEDPLAGAAALAVSADGAEIAAVSHQQRGAVVWRTADLSRVRVVPGGAQMYTALADGSDALTAGDGVRRWGDGAALVPDPAVTLIPLGDHRVLADEKIVNTATGEVRVLTRDSVQAAARIDRTHVITGSYHQSPHVWDLDRPAQPALVLDSNDATHMLAVAATGQRAVSRGWTADARVELWDVGHLPGPTLSAAAGGPIDRILVGAPDRIAVHLEGRATQLRSRTLELIATLAGWPVAFRPGRDEVITDDGGVIEVYAARDGARRREVRGPDPIWHVAVSPDGARIATSSSAHVTVRDADWTPLLDFDVADGDMTALAIDDAGRVITGHRSGAVRVWDGGTAALLSTSVEHTATVNAIALRGETVVTGSWDLTLRSWQTASATPGQLLKRFDAGANDIELSPSGRLMASTAGDPVVELWERAQGRLLARYPTTSVATQAAFLDEDHVVVGGQDGRLEIFDLAVAARSPAEVAAVVAAGRWQLVDGRAVERR